MVLSGLVLAPAASAAVAPVGNGFTVTPSDLAFILKQIKIAEFHVANTTSLTGPCGALVARPGDGIPDEQQVPDIITSYGLRTVDGSCNNLVPGRETFAAADQTFPRLASPVFRDAEGRPAGFFGPGSPAGPQTSYTQKKGTVYDTQPRTISNLIVDQTYTNPAAVAAAEFPVRTQGNPGQFPCTVDPHPLVVGDTGTPANCVPSHKTLFIPNVTTDVGLSPPYNSLFTFFGQFFDHGVDQTFKSGGTVFVPLRADDPLITLGPDGKANTGDEVQPDQAFMVLTRAKDQPGPDAVLGTNGAARDAKNTASRGVAQSQPYTSPPSHQASLRESAVSPRGRDGLAGTADDNGPVATGKLLGDPK